MIFLVVILPLLAGAALLGLRRETLNPWLLVATALLHAAVTASFWWQLPAPALNNWLALDALGLYFLSILTFLFLLCATYGAAYLRAERRQEHQLASPHLFYASLLFFLATMSLVTISRHLGLLWVAVEATTLASAPLIFHHRSREALEATWKYLVICSVGIALALLGLFFLAAAITAESGSLLLDELRRSGAGLDRNWVRAAFIFFIVGYGTKMGLAPLHTWLPDAHSEAPAPASALLSGALLNCAFLAILRSYQVVESAGEGLFARRLLLLFALISLIVAAAFILFQNDYKRMLAYSSVEHMGILALGIGLGPAAWFFALLHALNHSLAKAMLFLTSGNILLACRSKRIDEITGLRHRLPLSAMLWVTGFLAITGTPPFAPFISEFGLLGAAVQGRHWLAGAFYLFALIAVFIGMARSVLAMVHSQDDAASGGQTVIREHPALIAAPLILLGLLLLFGLHLPAALTGRLHQAVELLGGAL